VDRDPASLLAALEAHAEPVVAAAGEILFRPGEPGEGIYLVRSGSIALAALRGKECLPVATRLPGAIVGLGAVLNGTHTLTGHAAEPARLGFVAAPAVLRLLACYPRLRLEALKLMAKEFAQVVAVVDDSQASGQRV
jgi:CRP-like cAMP-binding protein